MRATFWPTNLICTRGRHLKALRTKEKPPRILPPAAEWRIARRDKSNGRLKPIQKPPSSSTYWKNTSSMNSVIVSSSNFCFCAKREIKATSFFLELVDHKTIRLDEVLLTVVVENSQTSVAEPHP
jgi:hypothetical protein